MHLCRSSSNVPRLPSFLEMPQNPHVLLTFDKVHNPLRLPERHLNVQKWSEPLVFLTFWLRNVLRPTTACTFSTSTSKSGPSVFSFFTSKCASRRHGVHFFDIATSKSGPKLSEAAVFCTFWLGNVLRATTACTFSTSQLPKVVRTWCVTFWLGNVLRATTACTFSTSQLPKWSEAGVLCTFWLRNVLRATAACTFSSLIWPDGSAPAALASLVFDPPEPQNIGKTQCFATFLPFRASASSFFLLFLFYSSFF